jgi:hypothetical protein
MRGTIESPEGDSVMSDGTTTQSVTDVEMMLDTVEDKGNPGNPSTSSISQMNGDLAG